MIIIFPIFFFFPSSRLLFLEYLTQNMSNIRSQRWIKIHFVQKKCSSYENGHRKVNTPGIYFWRLFGVCPRNSIYYFATELSSDTYSSTVVSISTGYCIRIAKEEEQKRTRIELLQFQFCSESHSITLSVLLTLLRVEFFLLLHILLLLLFQEQKSNIDSRVKSSRKK